MRAVASCLVVAVALGLPACGGGAESVKEQQVELPPADPRAVRLFVAGARLMKQGKDSAARARFERALKIDSTVWEAHYNLGVLDRRRGALKKAVTHFQAALKVQPGAQQPRLALAEAHYALGNRGTAGDLLEELVEADPDLLDARISRAMILREQGDYDAALEEAREVLVRDPQSVRALAEVGRVYLARERLDVAALVFDKALALTGEDDGRLRARIHTDLGLVELRRGDTQAAFQQLGRAIAIDSGYAPARLNQGSVLLKAGDYEGAAAEYRAVLERDSDHVAARIALGVALRGMGAHDEAKRQYERVLKQQPGNADALFNLGVLRAEFLDQRPRSRALFQKFLDVAPSDHPKRERAERYLQEIPAPSPPSGQPQGGQG